MVCQKAMFQCPTKTDHDRTTLSAKGKESGQLIGSLTHHIREVINHDTVIVRKHSGIRALSDTITTQYSHLYD